MDLQPLTAISPLDGRYWKTTAPLSIWFSEHALIRYRLMVELTYFRFLCEIPLPELKGTDVTKLDPLFGRIAALSVEDAQAIKDIEKTTNHDVKAVEYWLKERLSELGIGEQKEFVHFGLTSQDINNTATPLLLKEFTSIWYTPKMTSAVDALHTMAKEWAHVPMLARTHGQPASPTRLGKELEVFVERLNRQLEHLRTISFSSKFGGATGNFNAHHVAYPEYDWAALSDSFVNDKLGVAPPAFHHADRTLR
jgi:adenylosuccinate lyase